MAHVYFVGGGKRDRTDDLLHAMQALSQLSYTPNAAKDYTESATSLPRELAIALRRVREAIAGATSITSRIRARPASRAARADCAHPVDDRRASDRRAVLADIDAWREWALAASVLSTELSL